MKWFKLLSLCLFIFLPLFSMQEEFLAWKQEKVVEFRQQKKETMADQIATLLFEATGFLDLIKANPFPLMKFNEKVPPELRVLFNYNFARELLKLPRAQSFEEIDQKWLYHQDYVMWKDTDEDVKHIEHMILPSKLQVLKRMITALLKSPSPKIDSLNIFSTLIWKKNVLNRYNFARELLRQQPVHSFDEVDMKWLHFQIYLQWQEEIKRAWAESGRDDFCARIEFLLSKIDSMFELLKKEPDDDFARDQALHFYNFARELLKLPYAHSFDEINQQSVNFQEYLQWKSKKGFQSWKHKNKALLHKGITLMQYENFEDFLFDASYWQDFTDRFLKQGDEGLAWWQKIQVPGFGRVKMSTVLQTVGVGAVALAALKVLKRCWHKADNARSPNGIRAGDEGNQHKKRRMPRPEDGMPGPHGGLGSHGSVVSEVTLQSERELDERRSREAEADRARREAATKALDDKRKKQAEENKAWLTLIDQINDAKEADKRQEAGCLAQRLHEKIKSATSLSKSLKLKIMGRVRDLFSKEIISEATKIEIENRLDVIEIIDDSLL